MNGFDTWCAALKLLLEAGEQGEALDLAAVTGLAEQARKIGPELDKAQREHVMLCIAKLRGIVRDGMRQMEREFVKVGERRVGIRGYGQLRTSHTAQRLRRRA